MSEILEEGSFEVTEGDEFEVSRTSAVIHETGEEWLGEDDQTTGDKLTMSIWQDPTAVVYPDINSPEDLKKLVSNLKPWTTYYLGGKQPKVGSFAADKCRAVTVFTVGKGGADPTHYFGYTYAWLGARSDDRTFGWNRPEDRITPNYAEGYRFWIVRELTERQLEDYEKGLVEAPEDVTLPGGLEVPPHIAESYYAARESLLNDVLLPLWEEYEAEQDEIESEDEDIAEMEEEVEAADSKPYETGGSGYASNLKRVRN